jgi:2-polyprenyl-6-methoxyphenol hydroxylase-like FAD-dependent oxidoreductase
LDSSLKSRRPQHVVIIGGGIGGCALALALQHYSIPCTVLEKDSSFDSRAEGYGLTMQQASTTLRSLGLHELLLSKGTAAAAHASFLSDGTLLSNYGRYVHSTTRSVGGNGKGTRQRFNVHIPRQDLRQMLLHKLQPGTVQWSSCFSHYQLGNQASFAANKGATDAKLHKVVLNDGRVIFGDLIVGADGIFSRVRRQKNPDVCLRYLDVITILGRAKCTHDIARNRVFQTMGGDTRLYAMPFRGDTVMWQLRYAETAHAH